MAKVIGEFELVDHGIDHAQYFQGCGTAHTNFTEVVTGAGSNAQEAIDDVLDQVGSSEWDVTGLEERLLEDAGLDEWPTSPDVNDGHEEDDEQDEDEPSEMYYYVSLRWAEANPRNQYDA